MGRYEKQGLKELIFLEKWGLQELVFFFGKKGLKELNFGPILGFGMEILSNRFWKIFANLGSRMANLVKICDFC